MSSNNNSQGSSKGKSTLPKFKGRAASLPPADKIVPPMSRLTLNLRESPIPEYLLGETSEATLRRAWDPYHQDATIERQVKIRNSPNLAAMLTTVPPFYGGTLSDFAAEINNRCDKSYALNKALDKLNRLAAKKEFPSHFNSIKVPTLQYAKGSQDLYELHWNGIADVAVTACKTSLLSAQKTFVAAQESRINDTLMIPSLCAELYALLKERYETRNEEGTYRVTKDDKGNEDVQLDADYKPYHDQLQSLKMDLPSYIHKVLDLKRELINKAIAHFKGKQDAKERTDIQMGDQSGSAALVTTNIAQEVARQVKAELAKLDKKPQASSSKVGHSHQRLYRPGSNDFIATESQRSNQEEENHPALSQGEDHQPSVRATLHPDALAALELSIARTRVLDCLSPHLYS